MRGQELLRATERVHSFKDTGEASQAQEGEDNGKGQTSRQEGWSRALEPEKSVDD